MKQKSAGMVMTIMLIAIFGWIAIVGFVIKPGWLVGAVLSVVGGVVIGVGIGYLMWRWWFKGGALEEERVYSYRKEPLGTRLVKNTRTLRFACAGEYLNKGTLVEANLAGRVISGQAVQSQELNDLLYGDVKAAPKYWRITEVLGWPLVDVKKGQFCWLQEFKKEEDKGGV